LKKYNIYNRLLSIILFVISFSALSDCHTKDQENITTKEDIITKFLTSFNDKDKSAIDQLVDIYLSPATLAQFGEEGRERYIGYLNDEKRFHGLLTFSKVKESKLMGNEHRVQAYVKSKNTELWYLLSLYVTQHKPYLLTRLYLSPAQSPEVPTQLKKLTNQEMLNTFDSYVQRLSSRGIFSGSILIAKDQKVLYKTAHGMASRRYNIQNNVKTKFNLGSMNKMFTSVSILQLIEAGKLALNDKLTEYLDRNWFGEGSFDEITIRQLLTHTSGIGYIPGEISADKDIRQLKDSISLLKKAQLNTTPGTAYRYSNTGMLLLGMVIEKVSGENYYQYINHHIYQPANMYNSGSFDIDIPTKNLAMGYYFDSTFNRWKNNTFVHSVKGGPAGGGYSTVEDLNNFANALTQYQLLSTTLTEQAYSAKPEYHAINYGYGFSINGEVNNRIIGHSGAFIGVSSILNIYLDTGFTAVVLANQGFASDPIIWKFNELLNQLEKDQ